MAAPIAPNTNNRDNAAPGARPAAQSSRAVGTPKPPRYHRLIPDLRVGEKVVLLQRHHPAVLFPRLGKPLALLALWVVGLVFVLPFIAGLQPDPLGPPPAGIMAWLPTALWIGWMGLAALLVLWAAYAVLDWSDDWIALTNRRLIIMDKKPFLRESRREAPVSQVQNVTAEYPNSMGVALDFGDLRVDTAGIGVLVFDNLPRPRTMREAIFDLQASMSAAQPSSDEHRRAIARSIILGTDPAAHDRPTPPNGIPTVAPRSQRVSGYGVFNVLFPFTPQRDEQSVTWHKHWIFLLRGVLLPILLALLLIAAWFASILFGDSGQYGPLPVILGWVAVIVAPVCVLWALWNWADWRNDLYRLDRERVHDIERLPLGIREQSKETLITRVTDVTYVVPSPLAHLLNYGDVMLKTPGEATEFNFKGVPRPRQVQQEIMDRLDEYRARGAASADREMAALLRAYHQAQREGR